MKRVLLLLLLSLLGFAAHAQLKSMRLVNVQVEGVASRLLVEQDYYENASFKLEALSPDAYFRDFFAVRVLIEKEGKRIYRKSWKNVCLYAFENGQMEVGREGMAKMVLSPQRDSTFHVKIAERGVE